MCACVCSYVCQIYECPARLLLFRARCSSDWRMRKRRRRGDNQVMRFDESVTPFYSLTLQCRLPLHYFVPLTPLCLLSPSQICLFSLFSPLLHALSVSIFFHSACLCLLSHPLRLPPPLPLTDVEADALGPQKESVSDIKRPNEWEPPVCVPAAK